MNRDVFFVAIFCGALIFGLWWWYVRSNPNLIMSDPNVPIVISLKDGAFMPKIIKVPADKAITLHFWREDDGSDAAAVSFPQLNYLYQLPMHQKVAVVLPPLRPGEVVFNSPANTFRGTIIVD